MSFFGIIAVALGAVFSENIVFSHAFGISPFISKSRSAAETLITGIAITVMTTLSALFTSIINSALLLPLDLTYLRSVVYILVIALVVGAASFLIKKYGKSFRGLPVSLFEVYSNTAVLGVCLFAATNGYNILESLVYGLFAGVGFTLAALLFSVVRDRMRYTKTPEYFEGLPMLLITAGLVALAFGGFNGMKFM